MKTRALAVAFAALLALPALAAQKYSIEYTPGACVKGGELPLMQLHVECQGEVRSFFRRLNSTDWCSVEGVNDGPLSHVVLPKFENGDEIEFFFVLLDGRRVVARSPRIFRLRVNSECEAPFARHVMKLSLSCGDDAGGIPSALGAGYAVDQELVDGVPPVGSPDRPVSQQRQ